MQDPTALKRWGFCWRSVRLDVEGAGAPTGRRLRAPTGPQAVTGDYEA